VPEKLLRLQNVEEGGVFLPQPEQRENSMEDADKETGEAAMGSPQCLQVPEGQTLPFSAWLLLSLLISAVFTRQAAGMIQRQIYAVSRTAGGEFIWPHFKLFLQKHLLFVPHSVKMFLAYVD